MQVMLRTPVIFEALLCSVPGSCESWCCGEGVATSHSRTPTVLFSPRWLVGVGITSPGPLGPEREGLAGPLTNEEAKVREL